MLNRVGVPWRSTWVIPVKQPPRTVTVTFGPPDSGENPVRKGAQPLTTEKSTEARESPATPWSVTGPETAPPGTSAVIWVSLSTSNREEEMPPKRTVLVPVKPVPVSVTRVPSAPLAGERPVTAGGGRTVREALDVALPTELVTWMAPLVAPGGTQTVNVPSPDEEKYLAGMPLKLTRVMPVNPEPERETLVLTPPAEGLMRVRVGALLASTTNSPSE